MSDKKPENPPACKEEIELLEKLKDMSWFDEVYLPSSEAAIEAVQQYGKSKQIEFGVWTCRSQYFPFTDNYFADKEGYLFTTEELYAKYEDYLRSLSGEDKEPVK